MTAWQRVRHIAPPEMFSCQERILFILEGQSAFTRKMFGKFRENSAVSGISWTRNHGEIFISKGPD